MELDTPATARSQRKVRQSCVYLLIAVVVSERFVFLFVKLDLDQTVNVQVVLFVLFGGTRRVESNY